jgi:Rad3-related DNA helicase
VIDINSVLARYAKVEQRAYQKACIKDIVDSLNSNHDIVIDLPTGAGKTLVFSPIAAEASESNLRTLVLTATKQGQRRISLEIERFLAASTPALIFGMQEYDCPILKKKAETWHCAERKEQCKKDVIDCGVLKADKEYNERKLVVTNFSKFLLARIEEPYDFIFLDDSHSFENSKEQAYQVTIPAGSAVRLYNTLTSGSKLHNFVTDFLNIF